MDRLIRTRLQTAAAALLLAATLGAQASDLEITPMLGYRVGGEFRDSATGTNRDIEEHASYGLALDLRGAPDTQYELTLGREDTTIRPPAGVGGAEALDLRIDYLQLGGTYFWSESSTGDRAPYVVGGLGVTRFTPLRAGLENRTAFSLNVGVGLRVPLAERLALRLEGRGYVTLLDTSGSVFCRSDAGDAACLIHARASGLWQIEVLAGLAFGL
jgi:opacity protein-like surface antigen